MFYIYYFFAKYFNSYKYDGLMGWSNMPKARVLYPCGRFSTNMEIGTAFSYAEMFGGQVVKPK